MNTQKNVPVQPPPSLTLPHKDGGDLSPCLPNITLFLPGVVLAILGTSFGIYWLINVDVASGLELARHLLSGKILYQDVIDHQFPAIYFVYLFIVVFSDAFGISAVNGFFLFAFVLLNTCIWVAWRILRINPMFNPNAIHSRRIAALILSAFYFALFILPFIENNWHLSFGEREHLLCALILPYLVLGINRLHSVETKPRLVVAAGVLAAFGFAIKPHFLLIFLASEFFITFYSWRHFKKTTIQSCLRTESVVILSILFGYYLGMVILKPEYFRLIPHVVDLYKGLAIPGQFMFHVCLFFALIPLLFFLWFLIEKKLRTHWIFAPYLSCLSIASIVIFALGVGGFYYHSFPFKFISLLLFAFVTCTHPNKTFSLFFLSLLSALMLKFGVQQFSVVQEKRNFVFKLAEKIRQYAPQGTVVPLDTNLAPFFPAINYAGGSYGLETPVLAHLPFAFKEYRKNIVPPPYHRLSQMGKLERFYHENIMHSLVVAPPALIMVNVSSHKTWLDDMPFSFIDYFSTDERFLRLWKNYSWVARVSDATNEIVFDFYKHK